MEGTGYELIQWKDLVNTVKLFVQASDHRFWIGE